MISLNRAQILGRLTRDPEMRYTPAGRSVTNFGVATNRRFKTADGSLQDQTEFHDVVAWGRLAEIANQYLHKGDPVYVDGRLQTRSWEAPDGARRQKTEIVAENVIALGTKGAAVEVEATTEQAVPGEPVTPEAKVESPADEEPIEEKPAKKPRPTKKAEPADQTTQAQPEGDEINLDDLPF